MKEMGVLLALVPFPLRVVLLAAFAAALMGFGYVKGLHHEEVKFEAYKTAQQKELLDATTKALAKTKVLTAANSKVSNDYFKEKTLRIAASQLASSRLHQLEASLSFPTGSTTATIIGTDDPRSAIVVQCARAVVELEKRSGQLEAQAAGLQGYAREVCLKSSE